MGTNVQTNTYRACTGVFTEASKYADGWNVGDEILFLGPDDDGTVSRLLASIVENRCLEFGLIRYPGET